MLESNQPYQKVADPTWTGAGIGSAIGAVGGAGLAGLSHWKMNKFKGMGWKGKTAAYATSALLGGGTGFFLGGVAGAYSADTNRGGE